MAGGGGGRQRRRAAAAKEKAQSKQKARKATESGRRAAAAAAAAAETDRGQVQGEQGSLRADAPEFTFSPAGAAARPADGKENSAPRETEPRPSSVYVKSVGAARDEKPAETRRLLQSVFSRFGKVKSVNLARQPKSSAIINFGKPAAAAKAVAESRQSDGIACGGRKLHVEFSRQKSKGAQQSPAKQTATTPQSSSKRSSAAKEQRSPRLDAAAPSASSSSSEPLSAAASPASTPTEERDVDEDTLLSSAICSGAWWEDAAQGAEEQEPEPPHSPWLLSLGLNAAESPAAASPAAASPAAAGEAEPQSEQELEWMMSQLSPSLSPCVQSPPRAALRPAPARSLAVGAR